MTPTAADQKAWSELLDGLPDDLRYTPLNGDKCPIDPDTGFRRKKWETFHYLPSDLDQMNGVVKAVGLHLGPTSNGVLAVDFDGIGSEVIFRTSPATKSLNCRKRFGGHRDRWATNL